MGVAARRVHPEPGPGGRDAVWCQITSGADQAAGGDLSWVEIDQAWMWLQATSPGGAAEDAFGTPWRPRQWAGPRKVRVAVAISYAARR